MDGGAGRRVARQAKGDERGHGHAEHASHVSPVGSPRKRGHGYRYASEGTRVLREFPTEDGEARPPVHGSSGIKR
jgi:hypothetical protein